MPPLSPDAPTAIRALFADWQLNGIATFNSGTPFTVSDSANVALQANSPPISGFPASRPNVIGDPNAGARTADEWLTRSSFERLNIQTQAGQFGNAGRNIARGPSYANVDVSFVRDFDLSTQTRLQFRAEVFNVSNTPHFGNPAANISNVVFRPDGSIQSLNGVGSITSTDRTGRQYDERGWRLGARFGF